MPGLSRKRRVEDEESDVEQDDETEDQNVGDAALNNMVKALVRLALAVEHQRKPLRRTEVNEKVIGSSGLKFKRVFEQAQHELRTIFGMELAELPSKEKVTVAQKRAAQKEGPKTVTSWILVSALPSEYHDPAIIPGSDPAYTAVYSMLVSLISLSGSSLHDAKMDRFLSRMKMEDTTPIAGHDKTEKLLKRLEKDGYIVKVKEALGNGDEEITWIVGPRGKIEIGGAGVKGLVEAVYGDPEDDEGLELARKIERSLGVGEKPVPTKKQRTRKERRSAHHDDGDDNDDDDDD